MNFLLTVIPAILDGG